MFCFWPSTSPSTGSPVAIKALPRLETVPAGIFFCLAFILDTGRGVRQACRLRPVYTPIHRVFDGRGSPPPWAFFRCLAAGLLDLIRGKGWGPARRLCPSLSPSDGSQAVACPCPTGLQAGRHRASKSVRPSSRPRSIAEAGKTEKTLKIYTVPPPRPVPASLHPSRSTLTVVQPDKSSEQRLSLTRSFEQANSTHYSTASEPSRLQGIYPDELVELPCVGLPPSLWPSARDPPGMLLGRHEASLSLVG